MKKLRLLLRYEWLVHVFFWLFLAGAFNVMFQMRILQDVYVNGKNVPVVFEIKIFRPLLIGLIFKIGFFYVTSHFLLLKGLKLKRLMFYGITAAIAGLLFFFLEMKVVDFYYSVTHDRSNGSIRFYLLKVSVLTYLFVGTVSLLYFFGKKWVLWEETQAKLREEHLLSQLRILNYQINPHFLFNTLNNLFALAEKNENTDLSFGIAKLADIMRYILYDCNKSFVSLAEEVMYVQDYIDISKIRMLGDKTTEITFLTEGDVDHIEIAPMVLIPLIENAFKHGIRYNQKSFIKILLRVESKHIQFNVANSKHPAMSNRLKNVSSIGLENLKQRLAIVYPETHELNIDEGGTSFSVNLKIPCNVY